MAGACRLLGDRIQTCRIPDGEACLPLASWAGILVAYLLLQRVSDVQRKSVKAVVTEHYFAIVFGFCRHRFATIGRLSFRRFADSRMGSSLPSPGSGGSTSVQLSTNHAKIFVISLTIRRRCPLAAYK